MTADGLRELGIETIEDLLRHRPRRYIPLRSIRELIPDEEAVVQGTVERAWQENTKNPKLDLVKAEISDQTGSITAVWFNQASLVSELRPGRAVQLRGTLNSSYRTFSASKHEFEGRRPPALLPVYPASKKVPEYQVRKLVRDALPLASQLSDPLRGFSPAVPLLRARDAIRMLHLPSSEEEAEQARRRLALEELTQLQLEHLRERPAVSEEAVALGAPGDRIRHYHASLPFTLTASQCEAMTAIDRDVASVTPMERLLQGDVGSGKTVVALHALLRAVENGHQGALMAPTETLAEQHLHTLENYCAPLGVRVALLSSSLTETEQDRVREQLAAGSIDIAVGTHALIQEQVAFRSLAVAVVDEEQRFGVAQRRALGKDHVPHVLHMSATPIPRTLARALYSEVAVSELALPPGRQPTQTVWRCGPGASAKAYRELRKLLDAGQQAYVVCPSVSPSHNNQLRAVEKEAEGLREGGLARFRIGTLHGQMPTAERRSVMEAFRKRQLDVLVATSVIEVGLHVPNATAVFVLEADRFGLAQLHQLRGRVGRGEEQSYCVLLTKAEEQLSEDARKRLAALVATSDGFALADVDLELRGAGDVLGTRQAGLSGLKFTSLASDRDLFEEARRLVERLLAKELKAA